MNNLQLLIITITVTIILASILILWKKGLLKIHKKKILTTLVSISILSGGITLMFTADIIVNPAAGNYVEFRSSTSNAYFRTNTSIHFSTIAVSGETSAVTFNTSIFKVTTATRINITVMKIRYNIAGAANGEELLDFYADGTGTVTFNLGGFIATQYYHVKKDNVVVNQTQANTTGYISFVNTAWTSHHFEVIKGTASTWMLSMTFRNNGIDYFTWLGTNTSAYYVYKNMTGFNEATEYIGILGNNGLWKYYYGDKTGTNFSIHTFDVVKSYMDDAAGNITFDVYTNPSINYNTSRTVNLKKIGNGYNYTGYTKTTGTTLLSINTTLTLPHGYFIGLWNKTTFTWNYWISGFGKTDKAVVRYNVIMTKIDGNKVLVL